MASLILHESGYEVIGLTMKTWIILVLVEIKKKLVVVVLMQSMMQEN